MTASAVARRGFLAASAALVAGAACSNQREDPPPPGSAAPGSPAPGAHPAPQDPDAALAELREGNARFAAGSSRHTGQDVSVAHTLATEQDPWVITLACADSRTPPELIFDTPIGAVFGHRVAGNVVDANMLGSMEYGLEHFGPPLLVVLGHERCGAVTATAEVVQSGTTATGYIAGIVDAITPAVLQAQQEGAGGDLLVESAVRVNARNVAADIVGSSAAVRAAVDSGALRVVAAVYDLDTSTVEFLD